MQKVILNEDLRSKLNGLNEHLELCDDTGKRLGHFLPEHIFREWLIALSKDEISSAEELDRRMQEPGDKTLKEIWQRLGVC
jgi:hypothetical protein